MSLLWDHQFLVIYTFSFYSCPLERMLVLLEAAERLGMRAVKPERRRFSPNDDRFPDNRRCPPFPSRLDHYSPLFVGAHRRQLRNHRQKTSEALSGRLRIEFRGATSRRNIPVEVPSFRQKWREPAVPPVGLLYPHKGEASVAHDRIRRLFLWCIPSPLFWLNFGEVSDSKALSKPAAYKCSLMLCEQQNWHLNILCVDMSHSQSKAFTAFN